MSTKDNWDDSSDDEEVDLPPDHPKGDAPTDPLYEAKEEYHEAQFVEDVDEPEEGDAPPDPLYEAKFVDAKESEEGGVGGYPPDEEYYSEEDEDYEDELDDYDKKLGRYVSCR